MRELPLALYARVKNLPVGIVKDESGEGVISAAIAVLIMAFLGAAMWVAFQAIFNNIGVGEN